MPTPRSCPVVLPQEIRVTGQPIRVPWTHGFGPSGAQERVELAEDSSPVTWSSRGLLGCDHRKPLWLEEP